mgnify:CR=1 FL=1
MPLYVPKGEKIRSGEKINVSEVIEELKSLEFTGYIEVASKSGKGFYLGFLFFLKGEPIIAGVEEVVGKVELLGKDALELILSFDEPIVDVYELDEEKISLCIEYNPDEAFLRHVDELEIEKKHPEYPEYPVLKYGILADNLVESVESTALRLGIPAFIMMQWLAPFLTEFPEKVSAFYWASRVRLAPMALLNMISSKVNQWTALIAMLPVVYSFSCGKASVIPLDTMHREELFLSMIMTIYGCVCLADLKFQMSDAFVMFIIWLFQFLFPHEAPFAGEIEKFVSALVGLEFSLPNTRIIASAAFIIAILHQIVRHKGNLFRAFKAFYVTMRQDKL